MTRSAKEEVLILLLAYLTQALFYGSLLYFATKLVRWAWYN